MTKAEIQTKIDTLKAEIVKEEQIKRGAESMQAAWMGSKGTSDEYVKSKENVDVCTKLIKEKSAEVERLTQLLFAPEVPFLVYSVSNNERSSRLIDACALTHLCLFSLTG